MNERTYRCTMCSCHTTVSSAVSKMTGQLFRCLANCVPLLSFLISILGSEIRRVLYLLSVLSYLSAFIFVCSCLLVVFKLALHRSMSHTPTSHLIGSTDRRGLHAYFTFWLLSSSIRRQMTKLVKFSCTTWILATLSHNYPCAVVSSLII